MTFQNREHTGKGWRLSPLVAISMFMAMGCSSAETPKTASKQAEAKPAAKFVRPAGVVGHYQLDDPAIYGQKSISLVPPGQIMHLVIEKGRWVMRDMMVGYSGTWVATKDGAMLTVTEGPTGETTRQRIQVWRTEAGIKVLPAADGAIDIDYIPAYYKYVGPIPPKGFVYEEFVGLKQ
ncbi:MAG: hypothetical protein ABL962_01910 [Fimbriimonadaceae bacterium]